MDTSLLDNLRFGFTLGGDKRVKLNFIKMLGEIENNINNY
jgi:hypothetical protein